MSNLKFIRASGKEITPFIADLGKVRISVFYDFPYLYEGNLENEKEYLDVYVKNPDSFLFAIYDGDTMIGATTAIPLLGDTDEVQEPFRNANYDLDKIFYFGESVLLPAYRSQGLGHLFFDEREKFVQSFGRYTLTTFCAVNRQDDHPLRPDDYRPNDLFWQKRGYIKQPHLTCCMSWLDRGNTSKTEKSLTFWTKEWK